MNSNLLAEILKLDIAERIQLVEDIWDSIAADPAAVPLTDEARGELDRRLDEQAANPGAGRPWSELMADVALVRAIQEGPDEGDRLADACSGLHPAEERALTEEGLAGDVAAWPGYGGVLGSDAEPRSGDPADEITRRLDRIYGTEPGLDPVLRRAQGASIRPE